ncbi:uncharacterized protein LOC114468191 isoform X10 [Gouania willdenowi]|uniref:uncharacterized protein LOC114468191 isoform X10 n=1 Tax=Gouania willdenowi TaxID=441366 RepID=UPI001054BC99|nr:uncharacterized protein LOC114468191 isoform X10 [Gouania willdenowi]
MEGSELHVNMVKMIRSTLTDPKVCKFTDLTLGVKSKWSQQIWKKLDRMERSELHVNMVKMIRSTLTDPKVCKFTDLTLGVKSKWSQQIWKKLDRMERSEHGENDPEHVNRPESVQIHSIDFQSDGNTARPRCLESSLSNKHMLPTEKDLDLDDEEEQQAERRLLLSDQGGAISCGTMALVSNPPSDTDVPKRASTAAA